MEKLKCIQNELKVPKNNYNSFGKYKFRNCEDILEAVKPLLVKYKCLLTLTDDLINVGNRYYIKSIAKITDIESKSFEITTGFAREPETKKGFDEMQITGAFSSYARKYALNGLFAIDDSKDADSFNNTKSDDPVIDPEKLKMQILKRAANIINYLDDSQKKHYTDVKNNSSFSLSDYQEEEKLLQALETIAYEKSLTGEKK